MQNRILLGCLLLSGFTGLAYELLWVRLLALGFGSTTLSFSTVLAVFFGGLALGTWWSGRFAARLRNPARVYALLELGTGFTALATYPLLVNVGAFFAAFDPGSGLAGGLARAAVAAPLLFAPTFMMGATLPVVTSAVVVDDRDVGSGTAIIYALNTLGAFLGAYGVTYFLLPELGIFRSTLAAAGVNGLVALIAWFGASKPQPKPTESSTADPETHVPVKTQWTAIGLAFFVGFAAICFQVVWARLMSIFLDGTIYGVGSVLICVLVGIGLGSLGVARMLRRSRDNGSWLGLLQCITLVSVLFITSNFDLMAYILRSSVEGASGVRALHIQLLWVLAFLLVPSVASGASFPVLVQIVEQRARGAARALARLYTSNTLGSILGSLLTGFLLIPYAGTVATIYLGLVVVALVGALSMAILSSRTGILRMGGAALPLALVASFGGFEANRVSQAGRGTAAGLSFNKFQAALNEYEEDSVFFSEGRSATVSVRSGGGTRSLLLNGLGQGGRQEHPPHHIFESLLVALIPHVYASSLQQGLVVGLGAGVTADALLRLGLEKITVVELEPAVVEGLEHIFPADASPLRNPRLDLRIGDARHHLLVEARRGGGRYDLITSMPAHPWVANNIFTREFFELARANLSDQGVFSTWFGLGRMDESATASLLRAFTGVFSHYIVHYIPKAGALYVVGSKRPLVVDIERMAKTLAHPLMASQRAIESPYYFPFHIIGTGTPADPPMSDGIVNTDDSAYVEIHAPRTSTITADPRALLPVPAIRPDMLVPSGRRKEIATELMEHLLGTPGGDLPLVRQPRAKPARVRDAFRALRAVMDSDTRRYFEGRLAIQPTTLEEARRNLEGLADPELGARAKAFLPLTFEDQSQDQREAFQAAPPSVGLWWAWLAKDQDFASAHLAKRLESRDGLASAIGQSPAGRLLLAAFAHEAPENEPQPLTSQDMEALGPTFQGTQNRALLSAGLRVIRERGWDRATAVIEQRIRGLNARDARAYGLQAERAYEQKDMRKAAKLFDLAFARGQLNRASQSVWLAVMFHLEDQTRLQATIQHLKFLGWTDEQIAHVRTQVLREPEGGLAATATP
ncbi:MAG: fused MFS/spermidine synthase [Myxococcota bacterium]